MASYNRIVLMGNLTRDPEVKETQSGVLVCKFGIATNHKYKSRDGEAREEVCFVECIAFAKAAETLGKYMAKGKSLLVEGRLKLDQWTTKDGEKKSKHTVAVEAFAFIGRRDDTNTAPPAAVPTQDGAPVPPDDDIPY